MLLNNIMVFGNFALLKKNDNNKNFFLIESNNYCMPLKFAMIKQFTIKISYTPKSAFIFKNNYKFHFNKLKYKNKKKKKRKITSKNLKIKAYMRMRHSRKKNIKKFLNIYKSCFLIRVNSYSVTRYTLVNKYDYFLQNIKSINQIKFLQKSINLMVHTNISKIKFKHFLVKAIRALKRNQRQKFICRHLFLKRKIAANRLYSFGFVVLNTKYNIIHISNKLKMESSGQKLYNKILLFKKYFTFFLFNLLRISKLNSLFLRIRNHTDLLNEIKRLYSKQKSKLIIAMKILCKTRRGGNSKLYTTPNFLKNFRNKLNTKRLRKAFTKNIYKFLFVVKYYNFFLYNVSYLTKYRIKLVMLYKYFPILILWLLRVPNAIFNFNFRFLKSIISYNYKSKKNSFKNFYNLKFTNGRLFKLGILSKIFGHKFYLYLFFLRKSQFIFIKKQFFGFYKKFRLRNICNNYFFFRKKNSAFYSNRLVNSYVKKLFKFSFNFKNSFLNPKKYAFINQNGRSYINTYIYSSAFITLNSFNILYLKPLKCFFFLHIFNYNILLNSKILHRHLTYITLLIRVSQYLSIRLIIKLIHILYKGLQGRYRFRYLPFNFNIVIKNSKNFEFLLQQNYYKQLKNFAFTFIHYFRFKGSSKCFRLFKKFKKYRNFFTYLIGRSVHYYTKVKFFHRMKRTRKLRLYFNRNRRLIKKMQFYKKHLSWFFFFTFNFFSLKRLFYFLKTNSNTLIYNNIFLQQFLHIKYSRAVILNNNSDAFQTSDVLKKQFNVKAFYKLSLLNYINIYAKNHTLNYNFLTFIFRRKSVYRRQFKNFKKYIKILRKFAKEYSYKTMSERNDLLRKYGSIKIFKYLFLKHLDIRLQTKMKSVALFNFKAVFREKFLKLWLHNSKLNFDKKIFLVAKNYRYKLTSQLKYRPRYRFLNYRVNWQLDAINEHYLIKFRLLTADIRFTERVILFLPLHDVRCRLFDFYYDYNISMLYRMVLVNFRGIFMLQYIFPYFTYFNALSINKFRLKKKKRNKFSYGWKKRKKYLKTFVYFYNKSLFLLKKQQFFLFKFSKLRKISINAIQLRFDKKHILILTTLNLYITRVFKQYRRKGSNYKKYTLLFNLKVSVYFIKLCFFFKRICIHFLYTEMGLLKNRSIQERDAFDFRRNGFIIKKKLNIIAYSILRHFTDKISYKKVNVHKRSYMIPIFHKLFLNFFFFQYGFYFSTFRLTYRSLKNYYVKYNLVKLISRREFFTEDIIQFHYFKALYRKRKNRGLKLKSFRDVNAFKKSYQLLYSTFYFRLYKKQLNYKVDFLKNLDLFFSSSKLNNSKFNKINAVIDSNSLKLKFKRLHSNRSSKSFSRFYVRQRKYLSLFYGKLSFKFLKKKYRQSYKKKSLNIIIFFCQFERLITTVLFRMGFVSKISDSIILIRERLVLLNNKLVTSRYTIVQNNDLVHFSFLYFFLYKPLSFNAHLFKLEYLKENLLASQNSRVQYKQKRINAQAQLIHILKRTKRLIFFLQQKNLAKFFSRNMSQYKEIPPHLNVNFRIMSGIFIRAPQFYLEDYFLKYKYMHIRTFKNHFYFFFFTFMKLYCVFDKKF